MPRPRAPRHALEAAKAAVDAGTPQGEAAARHGVGLRTLERALSEDRTKAPPRKPAKRPSSGRVPPSDREEAPSLLDTLAAELRDARKERRNPENTDAENRAWAKTIRELVSAIERIAPPPAPPPDQVQAELRRLDAVTIGLIEQFLPDPIKPEEITPP